MKFVILAHHKCASTWLQKFLAIYCHEYNLLDRLSVYSLAQDIGGIHIFAHLNSEHGLCKAYDDCKFLHIIRDPRDVIVSAYYSHKTTHPPRPWLVEQRLLLNKISKEAGMIATWLFLERMDFVGYNTPGTLYAFRHWNWDDDIPTVKTEDIATNPEKVSAQLSEYFGRDVSYIVDALTFEKIAGRKVGVIDNNSHYRSGLPGQWEKDMRPELAEAVACSYKKMIEKHYDK